MTEMAIYVVLFVLFLTVIVFAYRWQARQYRDYLAKHIASAEDLVHAQNATRDAEPAE